MHSYITEAGGGQWPHLDKSDYTCRLVVASRPCRVSLHDGVGAQAYTPFLGAWQYQYGWYVHSTLGRCGLKIEANSALASGKPVAHAVLCDAHTVTLVLSFKKTPTHKGLSFAALRAAIQAYERAQPVRTERELAELERIELERIQRVLAELEREELERVGLERIDLERIQRERIERERIERIELERIELERIKRGLERTGIYCNVKTERTVWGLRSAVSGYSLAFFLALPAKA